MAIKLSDKPAELSGGGATFVNVVIYFLIRFHVVELTPEDIAMLTLGLNIAVQAAVYIYMKRTTTALADPKTAEGVPLAPVVKEPTRGF